ncbi:hypothetical protein C1H46_042439 [Malus baccata]|uniref:Uncharacterized protein n=1 Tax=Malus baccata TaxID=106549 RepID=A0A540KCU7_MALBA|nr:hypothetical protein C1H46_042439 [Malus baccata]
MWEWLCTHFESEKYQHLDMPIEELTLEPEVSLQMLMDEVGRRKGKKVCNLGVCRVWEVGSSSSSSSTPSTETDSRLQHMDMELVRQKELVCLYTSLPYPSLNQLLGLQFLGSYPSLCSHTRSPLAAVSGAVLRAASAITAPDMAARSPLAH